MLTASLIIIGLFLLWLYLIAPGRRKMPMEMFGGYYAHRGLWNKRVPENSLSAFRRAREYGFGVELDVHLTSDGETVVFHDDDLKRMCGADKKVRDCTLRELREYRLLDSGECIPTLKEFLEAVGEDMPLIVEIKYDPRRDMICRKTISLLRERKGPFCVESFDPLIVRWFRKNEKKVFRGQLAYGLNVRGRHPLNIKNLVLSSLAVNVLGRPDFVAFDHQCEKSVPFRIMNALYHPVLAAWTLRDEKAMTNEKWDMRIFEGFIPGASSGNEQSHKA